MKRLLIIYIFIGIAALSFAQNKGDLVNVSGIVKLIRYSCSDDHPNPPPKPLPNKKLYVKQGDVNDFSNHVYMEFTSDRYGFFSISLPSGKYIIVEERKKDNAIYDTILARYGKGSKDCKPIDTTCFKRWYQKPDAVLNIVHDSIKNITLTFYSTCPGACDIPCAGNTWYKPR
jgi:hypothetical protein